MLRSLDFLPCIPGTGVGGFRPEAATWPGGGIELYLDALADAILPAVRAEFGLTADPARTALGGSSFGGIATLHAITSRHKLAGAFSAQNVTLFNFLKHPEQDRYASAKNACGGDAACLQAVDADFGQLSQANKRALAEARIACETTGFCT